MMVFFWIIYNNKIITNLAQILYSQGYESGYISKDNTLMYSWRRNNKKKKYKYKIEKNTKDVDKAKDNLTLITTYTI